MAMLRPFGTLKTACHHWFDDSASQMGAALAYYSLFSLAPLLFIAITVAGLVYGEATAREHVIGRISDLIGPVSADAVKTMLENFRHPAEDRWAAVIGLAALWYGALGVFTQLRSSLNRIWRVKAAPQRAVVALLKDYLLAFLMVLVSSVFVLALLLASTLLGFAMEWTAKVAPG